MMIVSRHQDLTLLNVLGFDLADLSMLINRHDTSSSNVRMSPFILFVEQLCPAARVDYLIDDLEWVVERRLEADWNILAVNGR